MKGVIMDKFCVHCGKPITYGVNGCMLLTICFQCHKELTGHYYPQYLDILKTTPKQRAVISWDDLDALEDSCLGDNVD